MPRVLLILLLAVLTLPAPHNNKVEAPVAPGLVVRATSVPLGTINDAPRRVGALTLEKAWQLTGNQRQFGGISSMLVDPSGDVLGLSDSGELFGFHIGEGRARRRPFGAPLPVRPQERSWPKWNWDSESLMHDPKSGRYWVGFELINRICRYAPAFSRVEQCAEPRGMRDWPITEGAEAGVRLKDGRFLIFSEQAYGPDNSTEVLLFHGDPAEPTTRSTRLYYRGIPGYRPTDAVDLGNGQLMLLHRRVTIAQGFTAKLAIVALPPLNAGTMLRAQPIATIAPPLPSDNFEALAITREGRDIILWVASDDNHLWFQRTLLLKFRMTARD